MQPQMREARENLGQAGENALRFGANLREASGNVLEAGTVGAELARDAASRASERLANMAEQAGERLGDAAERAGERLSDVAGQARERVGDTARSARRGAVGIGIQLLHLPQTVRQAAQRSVETVENAGTRAVVSVLHAGTRVMKTAAELVGELAPRRRADRRALEDLVAEQLRWAHTGSEAFDRAAADNDDDETRVRLVRGKLQMIRQAEVLTQLLRDIGGSVPAEEKTAPPPAPAVASNGARGPAAARQGLGYALTAAVQNAEGWRALAQIAAWAAPDGVADAMTRATVAVGEEPREQVEFLREALLQTTCEAVLR